MSIRRVLSMALAVSAVALSLSAQNGEEGKLPLDKLLDAPISTGAKYSQQLSSVAASVTVVTDEEIARYGWTTLPELLDAVAGTYLTYDRNYTYIGIRGIGRPTDYNTRLLTLIDGQVLNAPVFGSGPIDIDISNIRRVEIVRGPGSAVYGSHAMLAVINIITKNADAIDGVEVSANAGSLDRRGAAVRVGKVFADGLHFTATAELQESGGADLFFPAYDSPSTNDGIAEHRDGERRQELTLNLQKGNLRFQAYAWNRWKGIPTGAWDTEFNASSSTQDASYDASIDYQKQVGVGRTLDLRAYYDAGDARGVYQYDEVGIDRTRSRQFGGEARYTWDIHPNQRLTTGGEYIDVREASYRYDVGSYHTNLERPFKQFSLYLQDEYHYSDRIGLVAGVRYDHYTYTRSSVSPRLALLFTPSRDTTVKLLYGTAFRAPNVYEAEFSDPLSPWKVNPDLRAETLRTTELVLERRLSPVMFFVGSAFHIGASDLIDSEVDPTDSISWYRNLGLLESNGIEASVEMRRPDGIWATLKYTAARATSNGDDISNSPSSLIKAGISNSPFAPLHGGVEAVLESSRLTRDGERSGGFLLVNGTASKQIGSAVRLGLTVRNLLDREYSNPVGPEFKPEAIRQDGRTWMVKITYTR